jgi:tetratricopeptide (TPR) repeat protein
MMTNYGISLHNLGSFDSALYYHLQSYDIKVSNNSSGQAIAKELVNIGNVYSTMDKNPEAIDYFEKAKTQFMAVGDTFNLRKCFNNIGLAYKRMGDTIQAIDNYKYSEQLSRATNYPQGIATSLINLSSLYAGQNQTTQAELALKEAIKLSESIQDIQLISNATQNLASLYFKLGQNDQALAYALKAKDLAGKSHELDLEKMVFQLISQIYEAKGDYQQSLLYHKKYTTLHDSLFNVDNTQRFNELQTVFETAQKEQQIALMKNEQEKQLLETKMLKARQRVILGAAVAIILLFIVLVYNIIIRRKKDKEIHRQKELFHKKAQELSEAELEKRRIQEEELRQSVLYKSKQLSTHALHMMQKNTLLQEIQDDIKTLSKKVPANERMEYRRINQQINQSLRADNDWDVFKLYFEEVNRDFYTQLNEISPELTTNDHRLCALIKLNMNSKEMASVLNVAPNSIKSSRYRLKKKLGLDMEADLEEFIRSLS